jgi:hypothetical protein
VAALIVRHRQPLLLLTGQPVQAGVVRGFEALDHRLSLPGPLPGPRRGDEEGRELRRVGIGVVPLGQNLPDSGRRTGRKPIRHLGGQVAVRPHPGGQELGGPPARRGSAGQQIQGGPGPPVGGGEDGGTGTRIVDVLDQQVQRLVGGQFGDQGVVIPGLRGIGIVVEEGLQGRQGIRTDPVHSGHQVGEARPSHRVAGDPVEEPEELVAGVGHGEGHHGQRIGSLQGCLRPVPAVGGEIGRDEALQGLGGGVAREHLDHLLVGGVVAGGHRGAKRLGRPRPTDGPFLRCVTGAGRSHDHLLPVLLEAEPGEAGGTGHRRGKGHLSQPQLREGLLQLAPRPPVRPRDGQHGQGHGGHSERAGRIGVADGGGAGGHHPARLRYQRGDGLPGGVDVPLADPWCRRRPVSVAIGQDLLPPGIGKLEPVLVHQL